MTGRRDVLLRWAVLLNGTTLLATGLLLATQPAWFYTHLAPFSPYNRHFATDAGIFSAALGACLLLAARNPRASPALAGIGAGASVGHAVNHLYDHWREAGELSRLLRNPHVLTDIPLFVLAGLSLFVLVALRPR